MNKLPATRLSGWLNKAAMADLLESFDTLEGKG
jgi:hypothetical protein